jgi:hypothetical protein
MKDFLWYVWLTVLILVITMLAFGEAFFHPNDYFFSGAGDGFKAYYATEFYLRHQSGGSWHEAFQYPFGSHVLYMDMNPLVSGFLHWLQPIVDLSAYTVGIINLLMLLGFIPCAWLLFALLRRSHLPRSLAFVFSIIFAFFSPQVDRMIGHFSLAIVFFVPLIWYVTLRIAEGNAKQATIWLIGYGTLVSLFGFMHPYYALLGTAWLIAYTVITAWQRKEPWEKLRWRYASQMLVALSPSMIVSLWGKLTQQGPQDFVTRPFGMLFYRAGPETIFLPRYSPFNEVWDYFIRVRTMSVEGYAYIGLAGTLIVVSTLYRIFEHLRKGKGRRVRVPVLPHSLRSAIWAGTLLLIPAMAYPMLLWPDMVEYMGPLVQFRSLGRLAWLFFYPTVVFSAWWLYAVYRALGWFAPYAKLRQLGVGLMLLAMLSWSLNAAAVLKKQRTYILKQKRSVFIERAADYEQLLGDHGFKSSDFQAILGIPNFHIGSEKFSYSTPSYHGERAVMAVSLQTGLPICNGMAARSPLTPSRLTLQLTAHPQIDKELPAQFPNDKPILLVIIPGKKSPGEAHLIAQATLIAETDFLTLARLDLSAFDDRPREAAKSAFYANKDSLILEGPLLLDRATNTLVWQSFGPAHDPLGQGSLLFDSDSSRTFWRGPVQTPLDGSSLDISFWVFIDQASNYLPRGKIRQYQHGQIISDESINLAETHDVVGQWARVEFQTKPIAPAFELEIWLKGNQIRCDQLLIRPSSLNVYLYQAEDSLLMLNNYPLQAHDWGGTHVP